MSVLLAIDPHGAERATSGLQQKSSFRKASWRAILTKVGQTLRNVV